MSESERRGPLWDIMEGRRPLPAVARLLGSKVLSIDPDGQRVKLEFLARPEFLNVHGMVQGGLLSAMFDDAMAAAVTSSGGGFMAPTLELKTSFIRPAPGAAVRGRVGCSPRTFDRVPGGAYA
jgi:uncharacterized protein (TIGR00369 family)